MSRIRMTRQTGHAGESLYVGQEYDVEEHTAAAFVRLGRAVYVEAAPSKPKTLTATAPEVVETRDPIVETRDPKGGKARASRKSSLP